MNRQLFNCYALCVGLGALVSVSQTHAQTDQLDPNKPEDAILLMQKSICSLNEGETVLYWWKGSMFSRVEGERDRVLFGLQGMNIRQCQNAEDETRGHGFRSVSREIMIHLDPETNQIVDTWENPWTGEQVDVIHVANDPVNMRAPWHAYGEDGKGLEVDITVMGDKALRYGNTPLFYKNPLQGEYQDYVGGMYHAMEMGSDSYNAEELFDRNVKTIKNHSLSWSRISGWLPWMKMGDRNGVIFTATVGSRANSIEDLPEPLRSVLKERYPDYVAPPPLDDARPNETSWEVFKKKMEAKEKDAGQ